MADKPSVLFVCVHNAGRSQMAAAWLTHLAGDRVEVRSAGSNPGDQVNPAAVEAMAEVGIDISKETPKILPGEGRKPETGGGTLVDIDVSAPGRTGHHIVYMIWQASHFDQSFYSCSDVWFGDGQPTAREIRSGWPVLRRTCETARSSLRETTPDGARVSLGLPR